MYHRQCKLIKGDEVTVAWIPEKSAIMGNFLKLKNSEGWVKGWKVVSINTKINSKYVIDRSLSFKN